MSADNVIQKRLIKIVKKVNFPGKVPFNFSPKTFLKSRFHILLAAGTFILTLVGKAAAVSLASVEVGVQPNF